MGVKEENDKEALDSLIALYGDLPICGNVAVAKYKYLKDEEEIDVKQRIEYIDNALKRWGTWKNTNYLRNEREALTAPMFQMWVSENVGAPHKERILKDIKVRNINDLTLTITRTTLTGDDNLSPRNSNSLAKIKTKLLPATAQTVKRTYSGNAPYEVIEDSVGTPSLRCRCLSVRVGIVEQSVSPTIRTLLRYQLVCNGRRTARKQDTVCSG